MRMPSRFAVHDVRSVQEQRHRLSRQWDFRFVSAVLLLYGCLGAAFLAVEWLHAAPDDEPPSVQELRDWRGRSGLHPVIRPHAAEPAAATPGERR